MSNQDVIVPCQWCHRQLGVTVKDNQAIANGEVTLLCQECYIQAEYTSQQTGSGLFIQCSKCGAPVSITEQEGDELDRIGGEPDVRCPSCVADLASCN